MVDAEHTAQICPPRIRHSPVGPDISARFRKCECDIGYAGFVLQPLVERLAAFLGNDGSDRRGRRAGDSQAFRFPDAGPKLPQASGGSGVSGQIHRRKNRAGNSEWLAALAPR